MQVAAPLIGQGVEMTGTVRIQVNGQPGPIGSQALRRNAGLVRETGKPIAQVARDRGSTRGPWAAG
jgi:hypothetical protein